MYNLNTSVVTILERDLGKVITELNAFQDEQNIWALRGKINNTSGNLALHIGGAVSHFIGAVLGNNGYQRNREKEFSDKNIPRDEVISKINEAITTVKSVLPSIDEDEMQKEFPEKIGGQTLSKGFFLTHLVSHINYHLGQINYHRRLVEE
jgi:uncharacterized damage-inducible protein DinB